MGKVPLPSEGTPEGVHAPWCPLAGGRAGKREVQREPPGHGARRVVSVLAQAVVSPLQPYVGHPTRNGGGRALQLVRGSERVSGARHEEARDLDRGKVAGAEPLRVTRGVERVAHQREARSGQALRDDLRADPSAHGPPSEDEFVGPDTQTLRKSIRSLANARLEHLLSIGPSTAGEPVREVHAIDPDASHRDRFGERHESGAVRGPSGSWGEKYPGHAPPTGTLGCRPLFWHGR